MSKVIQSIKGRVMDGDGNLNKFGIIDSGKLQNYDPETGIVKLRMDDSNVPGFWMEIDIKFENLEKWVEKMKKMDKICENDNYCDSSDEEEKDEKKIEDKEEKEDKDEKDENTSKSSYPLEPPRFKEHCTGFNCVCWKRGIHDFCEYPKYNMCMRCYNPKCIRSTKGHQAECDKFPRKV